MIAIELDGTEHIAADEDAGRFTRFVLKRVLKYCHGNGIDGLRCRQEDQFCPANWPMAMFEDAIIDAIRCVETVYGIDDKKGAGADSVS